MRQVPSQQKTRLGNIITEKVIRSPVSNKAAQNNRIDNGNNFLMVPPNPELDWTADQEEKSFRVERESAQDLSLFSNRSNAPMIHK